MVVLVNIDVYSGKEPLCLLTSADASISDCDQNAFGTIMSINIDVGPLFDTAAHSERGCGL